MWVIAGIAAAAALVAAGIFAMLPRRRARKRKDPPITFRRGCSGPDVTD